MDKLKMPTLVATGLLAGVAWRVELEWHGWAGLDWLGYFHWAIPFGFALFFGWLFLYLPVPGRGCRLMVVLGMAIVSFAWFQLVEFALVYYFNGGPGAFVELIFLGEARYRLYANMIYVVIPLTPLLFALLLVLSGAGTRLGRIGLALAIYMSACPVSIAVLEIIPQLAPADAIHTIKSGVIIPLLVIGLGILVPQHPRSMSTQ